MAMGTYTGQYQAGWNVTGNSDYVVYGGEFPSVNGVGQQGLVRFAGSRSPRTSRARASSAAPSCRGSSPVVGHASRVSWPAGYDRDDRVLTYRVIRERRDQPVHTTTPTPTGGRCRRWASSTPG